MDASSKSGTQLVDAVLIVKVLEANDIPYILKLYIGIYVYPVKVFIMSIMHAGGDG